MNLTLTGQSPENIQTEALAVIAYEAGLETDGGLRRLDALTGGLLAELFTSGEATGKPFDAVLIHRPQGLAARRVLLMGGGKADHFDAV